MFFPFFRRQEICLNSHISRISIRTSLGLNFMDGAFVTQSHGLHSHSQGCGASEMRGWWLQETNHFWMNPPGQAPSLPRSGVCQKSFLKPSSLPVPCCLSEFAGSVPMPRPGIYSLGCLHTPGEPSHSLPSLDDGLRSWQPSSPRRHCSLLARCQPWVGWAKAGAGEERGEKLDSVPWPWRRETFKGVWVPVTNPRSFQDFRFLTWPQITPCWICWCLHCQKTQGWHESSPMETSHPPSPHGCTSWSPPLRGVSSRRHASLKEVSSGWKGGSGQTATNSQVLMVLFYASTVRLSPSFSFLSLFSPLPSQSQYIPGSNTSSPHNQPCGCWKTT